MANAVRADASHDRQAAEYWRQSAAGIWECIEEGNQAALEYLQRETGYTRSGYHGRKVNGITTGRWEDAHTFIIGSDPQLHINSLVLNRIQRERDGAWRTLDSNALYEHRGAASAIAALVMESAVGRWFGVGWTQRRDGHGREVTGVPQPLMDQFSSRRQSISALTLRLAQAFEAQHGRKPDARALGELRQWPNQTWRKADLIRHVGELMPDNAICRDSGSAAVLLEHLADEILQGAGGEQVLALTAPEWPVVLDVLRPRRRPERLPPARRDPVRHRDPADDRGSASRPGASTRRTLYRASRSSSPARRTRGATSGSARRSFREHGHGAPDHRLMPAPGSGRCRVRHPDQRPPRGDPGRPGRLGQDPHCGRLAQGWHRRRVRTGRLSGRPQRPA